MKPIHVPEIDARYWLAITLVSICGTNLGDLYAHESGLGLSWGLCLLAVLAGVIFLAERRDNRAHEAYYWLAIIIIRTGATNVADALRHSLPAVPLVIGLAALMAALAWRSHTLARDKTDDGRTLPDTHAVYWAAMLTAGVLGTVLGDDCSHLVGQGIASLTLAVILGVALIVQRASPVSVGAYWTTVALARTAGTAIGDWLAENKLLDIGLPLSTALSGVAFVAVLVALSRRGGGRFRSQDSRDYRTRRFFERN
jgi:uncharacterized membrane-anchored protein